MLVLAKERIITKKESFFTRRRKNVNQALCLDRQPIYQKSVRLENACCD